MKQVLIVEDERPISDLIELNLPAEKDVAQLVDDLKDKAIGIVRDVLTVGIEPEGAAVVSFRRAEDDYVYDGNIVEMPCEIGFVVGLPGGADYAMHFRTVDGQLFACEYSPDDAY